MFTEKTFSIPELKGISKKSIEEHLKLYSGYVKNANTVLAKIEEYAKDPETHAYALGELSRRFSFEFCGMRNHETYFSHFEGGARDISEGALKTEIEKTYGSFELFLNRMKAVALTRGIGWAMLSYDKNSGKLLTHWVDEQHLGHLATTQPILALDMWEHSFVADYAPSGKKNYVEDFFANLNWETCEKNYATAIRS